MVGRRRAETEAGSQRSPASSTSPPKKRRTYAPRIWLGSDFWGLLQLLARNRFRVGWRHWYIVLIDLVISVGNTALRQVQHVTHGRAIARTKIDKPPLFILGHWRTGTTLLHELLVLDERHKSPTTFQCLCPNHFLLTEWLGTRTLGWMMPSSRPMDNMAVGWNRPQEDEFALCNLGVPSPYLTLAFPNEPPQYPEYYDLEAIDELALDRWKRKLDWFFRAVTYRTPGRLVLKSPPHTCRIKTLLELFPDARFVYLVRDPYLVYASTMHLWPSLYAAQGFQSPTCDGLEEYVLSQFVHMHERFEATRHLIPPGRLVTLRYEDLVDDPLATVRSIYAQLELGDFEPARATCEAYLAEHADYATNRYRPLTAGQRETIRARWSAYIEQHGYDRPSVNG